MRQLLATLPAVFPCCGRALRCAGQPGRAQPRKGQPRRQREGEGGPDKGRRSTRGPPPLSSSALVFPRPGPTTTTQALSPPSPLLPPGSLASSIWFFPCSHQMSPPQEAPQTPLLLSLNLQFLQSRVGRYSCGTFLLLCWGSPPVGLHDPCHMHASSTPVPHHQGGGVPTRRHDPRWPVSPAPVREGHRRLGEGPKEGSIPRAQVM